MKVSRHNYDFSVFRAQNISNYKTVNKSNNDFIKYKPILKNYGPLILDINNFKYDSGIFFIPMINNDQKPLFLAINCNESFFNINGDGKWNNWFTPFFGFELNILDDFCNT